MKTATLQKDRVLDATLSFNVRTVPITHMTKIVAGNDVKPKAGDLVLAKVIRIGQHTRIQNISGRRSRLYLGDEIIICYGNRYSSHQFESLVPDSLKQCNLVASGGVASEVQSRHSKMKQATVIMPIGIIADDNNKILNIAQYKLPEYVKSVSSDPIVLAVTGTEMNAGKTTTAASIVKSGVNAGLKVAAIKTTGTGACGDYFELLDAGACVVFDIVDAGLITTYKCNKNELEHAFNLLVSNCLGFLPDAIVVELGDGILQDETSMLLSSPEFKNIIDAVVIASNDALGAISALTILQNETLPVTAICGVVASSALGRESIEKTTGIASYSLDELRSATTFPYLIPQLNSSFQEIC